MSFMPRPLCCRENYANCRTFRVEVCSDWLSQSPVFWLRPSKNTTFRKSVLLPSSGKEAPNPLVSLDWAVLRHWAAGLGGALPENGSRAGFRNVVFLDGQFRIKKTVSVSLQNRQILIVSKPVLLFRDHIGGRFVIGYRVCRKCLRPASVKRTINFYSPCSSIL